MVQRAAPKVHSAIDARQRIRERCLEQISQERLAKRSKLVAQAREVNTWWTQTIQEEALRDQLSEEVRDLTASYKRKLEKYSMRNMCVLSLIHI